MSRAMPTPPAWMPNPTLAPVLPLPLRSWAGRGKRIDDPGEAATAMTVAAVEATGLTDAEISARLDDGYSSRVVRSWRDGRHRASVPALLSLMAMAPEASLVALRELLGRMAPAAEPGSGSGGCLG